MLKVEILTQVYFLGNQWNEAG